MNTIIRCFLVLVLSLGFVARAQNRQLVKTPAQTWGLIRAIPPANQINSSGCEVTNFARITRPLQPAGSELAHGAVFSEPFCPWVGGAYGDISVLAGVMNPASLNDLGTYTITCRDILVGQADPTYCITGGICGPLGRACRNLYGSTAEYASSSVTIEVFNNLPTISVALGGTGLISGNDFAHDANVTLNAAAADADGRVTVRWRVVAQPPGSRATLASLTGASTSIRFTGQADFGTWEFEGMADDDQGERATTRVSLRVVNRTPQPVISLVSGGSRVLVGHELALQVSGDDDGGDYTAVQWEALPPRGSWGPIGMGGASRTFTMPTSRSSLGTWSFRVRVTDNETPALSGMSEVFPVEVYNERPVVTARANASLIGVGQPFPLSAEAHDPDGAPGPLTVRWIVIQAPNAAPVALGTAVPALPAASHPGTWVFRAQAEDDEGETANSDPVAMLVDAAPIAAIEGGTTITVRAPFDVNDLSWDPDSQCPPSTMLSDPHACHAVAPGEAFTPLSGGLTHWTWYLDSVPAGYELFHPPGRIGETFPSVHSGYSQVLHVDEGQMPFGTYRLRVEVRDAEGTTRSASVQLRVLAPEVPPTAHINMPQRYLLGGSRQLLTDVVLDGTNSFDLDDALSDLTLPWPGAGIASWQWAITPPGGCSMPVTFSADPRVVLFPAGRVISEDACLGVWNATLLVTETDPAHLTDVRSQDFVIGRCAGEVCIDRPTHERPQLVDTGAAVDVPIYYYVEPSLAARYSGGFYGVIEIIPAGGSTPIYTLYDSAVWSRPAGTLNVVHWHGERSAGGLAPSGTYDVRLRISDTSGALFDPSSDRAPMAILFEDARSTVAATSARYSRYEDLEAGMNRPGFDWSITGAISVDGVRMQITRVGAGVAMENTTATTRISGRFEWDGRASGGSAPLPPGDYDVRIMALRGTRILATSAPWRHTVYRLRLGPTAPGALSVGVNDDDDNMNGVADRDELNVTDEFDLTAVAVSVEPPSLTGTLAVLPADGGTGVAVFLGATKTAPAPASVAVPGTIPAHYVEGRTPGRSALVLRFTPPTGPAFPDERREVNVTGIEILNASGMPAANLVPGLWEHGVEEVGGAVLVHNTSGDSFIDVDPSRFIVRVTDLAANLDAARRERISASVGTLVSWPLTAGSAERFADALTPVELLETGVDTGVFVSEPQLLTNVDELPSPDDEFEVHSDYVGHPVVDEGNGDRTHRVGSPGESFIRGGVRAQYGMMRPATSTVPVCGRGAGDRRAVQLRPRTIIEPWEDLPAGTFSFTDALGFSFNDTNGDGIHQVNEESEPYVDMSTGSSAPMPGGALAVTAGLSGHGPAADQASFDAQLRSANMAWAPACLEIRATAPLTALSSPALIGPGGPMEDGILTMDPERDALHVLLQGSLGPFVPGVIDVVMGMSVCEIGSGRRCHAYTDAPAIWHHLPEGLIVLATHPFPNHFILAHELGHGMTNNDSDRLTNPQWHFYPAGVTRPDDHNQYRHFPSLIDTWVHTPWTPGSGLTTPGNAYLSPF